MFHFSPRPNRAAEIDWQRWSPEVFERAAASDRLVLLSLSAVWCHWCHVMDETTYSDDVVIRMIAEGFIAVRVDTDERPDINLRYNMGGWPTTAILTAQGQILSGSTYVPPGSMPALLERIMTFYRSQRDSIATHLAQLRDARDARIAAEPMRPDVLDPAIAGEIMTQAIEHFDEENGGFGAAPKFPQHELLSFMLSTWRVARMEEQRADRREIRSGVVTTKAVFTEASRRYEAMLRQTLSGMIYGGLYDRSEGGFYRYSTEADWSIPHYEKLTEEQAGLLVVVAEIYRMTRDADLQGVLQKTWQWIRDNLYNEQTHLFASSQDADEAYAKLDAVERKHRAAPYVDRTAYSHASAAIAGALFVVGDVLQDEEIAGFGVQVLDALHTTAVTAAGLIRHVAGEHAAGKSHVLLLDQVAYLRALLDAHEHCGEQRFLERARIVADAMLVAFLDDGRLRDHAQGDGIGALAEHEYPIGENATAADALLRLSSLLGQDAYREQAELLLRSFAHAAREHSLYAASYAKALSRALSPRSTLHIHASASSAQAFRRNARLLPDPYLTVRTDVYEHGEPSALLCRGTVCAAPVGDAASLRERWNELLSAAA